MMQWFHNLVNRLRNALLVWRCPFAKPHALDGGNIPGYDYSYTFADSYPDGWKHVARKYFARIGKVLARYGETGSFTITDAKEKYGEARLYYYGCSEKCASEIDDIIRDFEDETGHTCCNCGRKADVVTYGYVLPFCNGCANKLGFTNIRSII